MGIFGKPENTPAHPAPHTPPAAHTPTPGPAPRGTPCVIGAKTMVKGAITGDEDVVVEGTVEGEIRISRELRIGPGGTVKATVEAQAITVSGEVIGDCQAVSRVEIQATGKLTGNIRAPKIMIAEGAMFRGNSDMSGRKDERKEPAKTAVS